MANFYTYRIAEVFLPVEGVGGVSSRFVSQFSSDSGTTWRDTNPAINKQVRLECQQELANIISNEQTFRDAVVAGVLGSQTAFYNYPPG